MRGAPEPAGKEVLGRSPVGILPELAEARLEGPGPDHLEIAAREGAEDRLPPGRHILRDA